MHEKHFKCRLLRPETCLPLPGHVSLCTLVLSAFNCDVPSVGTMVELLLWCWSCSLGSWQVEEARLKERQAAAAAAAEDPAASLGVASRKASGGSDAAPAIATENGEGDGLNISSSVVQVDHLKTARDAAHICTGRLRGLWYLQANKIAACCMGHSDSTSL